MKQSLSLSKINTVNTERGDQSNRCGISDSLQMDVRSGGSTSRLPTQTIVREARLLLNGESKPTPLTFELRAPWRRTNDGTRGLFDNHMQAFSTGKYRTPREIYVQKNLIPSRSLCDNRNSDNVPFKPNIKFDNNEYEVPKDSLLSKTGKVKLKKRKREFIKKVMQKREVEELTHSQRRQLIQLKHLASCQMPSVQRSILEQTVKAEQESLKLLREQQLLQMQSQEHQKDKWSRSPCKKSLYSFQNVL